MRFEKKIKDSMMSYIEHVTFDLLKRNSESYYPGHYDLPKVLSMMN